jgi:CRP/FNR family cyclic AMP-dependent transcriptional regulator
MACNTDVLKSVPLFALLDEEETAVLAAQVEVRHFAPRERIYKRGVADGQAYVMLSGKVRVTTVDEDQQEVIVDEPACGEFFGFASMLEQSPHQTNAIALEATSCLEVSRKDITILLERNAGNPQCERCHRNRGHDGREGRR